MSVHLTIPIRLRPDGGFTTFDEDSIEEITQCVSVVLGTRPQERLATPELGIPDSAFDDLDVDGAITQVETFEPRAELVLTDRSLFERGTAMSAFSIRSRQG